MGIRINGISLQKWVKEGWDRKSCPLPKKPVRKSNNKNRLPYDQRNISSQMEPHIVQADKHETMLFNSPRSEGYQNKVLQIIEQEFLIPLLLCHSYIGMVLPF